MKASKNNSTTNGIILLILSLISPILLKAEKTFRDSISDDETNSLFIIGGVLAFGIGFYAVYSIIEKNKKRVTHSNKRSVSHRHHSHHRVVKKSA